MNGFKSARDCTTAWEYTELIMQDHLDDDHESASATPTIGNRCDCCDFWPWLCPVCGEVIGWGTPSGIFNPRGKVEFGPYIDLEPR